MGRRVKVPYHRRRSEHDPQAYGLAGSRGGVEQCNTRRSGHTLWRCGLFENVLAMLMEDRGNHRAPISETNTPGITASLNLHSHPEIYRTMPRTSVPADIQLRPDLRLGANCAAVRRVAAVVSWFERTAGLSSAHGNENWRDGLRGSESTHQ